MPNSLQRLTLEHLTLGSSSIDVSLQNHAGDVTVSICNRRGSVELLVMR